MAHPAWGVVALPLLARLYVREKDLPGIDPKHRPEFRTKLELAVELLRWVKPWLDLLGLPIWVVADGAYANAAFLKPAMALGMTVVSRLRKDAALRSLPGPRPAGKRGRPRTYGEDVIDLAKRGGQRRGWSSDTFELYGEKSVKKYKTFLATWRPAGGAIRVVLVDEPTGWRAYFCTDTSASVADILGMVADRFSLEITFRECKQVVGAGQQQVRFIWANIGAFHICLWTYTMTEAWAWGRKDGGVGGPVGLAVGQGITPPEPRGQAAGVASRIAGRGDSCGSTPRGDRGGNSGHGRKVAQPGCMTCTISRNAELLRPANPSRQGVSSRRLIYAWCPVGAEAIPDCGRPNCPPIRGRSRPRRNQGWLGIGHGGGSQLPESAADTPVP